MIVIRNKIARFFCVEIFADDCFVVTYNTDAWVDLTSYEIFSQLPVDRINYFLFSDKCTGLPDIFDLQTSTSLPVDHGTTVEVSCIPGYSLSGKKLITCIRDKEWEYEQTPYCVLGTQNFFFLP